MTLANKVAIITGGASGIGFSAAQVFAKKGANIVLFDLKEEVDHIAKEIGGEQALGKKVDITNQQSVTKAVDEVAEKYGKIDVLLNCAGIALLDDAENLSVDDWDKTMAINLKGTFIPAQAVGQKMIEQKSGAIINIASQAGIVAFDRHVAYSASKAGVIGMTKVLAYEWAEYNVRVNAISPTIIMTELGRKAWAGKVGEDMMKQIPIGRFGEPEEVANCAAFLASDDSSLVTGENLVCDGGYTIK